MRRIPQREAPGQIFNIVFPPRRARKLPKHIAREPSGLCVALATSRNALSVTSTKLPSIAALTPTPSVSPMVFGKVEIRIALLA